MRRAGPSLPPIVDILMESSFPNSRVRCIAVPDGERARVFVNSHYGLDAYEHAACHGRQAVLEHHQVMCRVGEPCGFEPPGRPVG